MTKQARQWTARAAMIGIAVIGLALAAYGFIFQPKDVSVAAAANGSVALEVHGPGNVEPRFPVVVGARITATITRLLADQGDAVRRGQLLAQLDDRDLVARETAAATELDLARGNYRRDRAVFDKGYLAQAALDATNAALRGAEAREAEAAAAHSYARITSPIDGVITAREVEMGQAVGPGTTLFRVSDPRTLWVAVRVDETVIHDVCVGQPASVALRSGVQARGKVARITLESDAATRELEVDVAFVDRLGQLAIDEEANVTIDTGEESGVVIPASALIHEDAARGALVVVNGRVQFRPLKTGATDGRRVIVRDGVTPGELVIIQPGELKPGARVHAVAGGVR
jgi:HlyD family secretion protein